MFSLDHVCLLTALSTYCLDYEFNKQIRRGLANLEASFISKLGGAKIHFCLFPVSYWQCLRIWQFMVKLVTLKGQGVVPFTVTNTYGVHKCHKFH